MMHALLTMASVLVLLVCCCGRQHTCASACCRRGPSLWRKEECRSTTGTFCCSKVREACIRGMKCSARRGAHIREAPAHNASVGCEPLEAVIIVQV
jgi:hypothetical protein